MAVAFTSPASSSVFADLLAAHRLPTADLADLKAEDCLVATLDGNVVGAVALQVAGAAGLLRSLVVAAPQRGHRLGAQLVDRAEALARARGLGALYLLTTTAEPFFLRRGYVAADRNDAPEAIRATREFSTLCPASSAFLCKPLA